MKLEQLIVQHLYNSKSVTLQGIGTIHLNPSVVLPSPTDKEHVVPENAFSFDYDLKATEDGALIDYIVQQTRKIRPLASSDLESYSILAKQFLNIGKPLVIEGVGTIQKNQSGLYEFVQGNFIMPKIDDIPKQAKEKQETDISFESERKKTGQNKVWVMAGFAIVLVAFSALGIYYYVSNQKHKLAEISNTTASPIDTAAKLDTAIKKPVIDSTPMPTPVAVPAADTVNFKVVIKDYPSEAAVNKAFTKLTSYGHQLEVIKVDSTRFQLAMPFSTGLSDTTRAKDSLKKRIFGGNPYILH